MANVRAGIAYVDVRLGDTSKLKNQLLAAFASMGKEISKKLGEEMNKNAPKEEVKKLGDTLGKTSSGAFTSAFLKDSQSNFRAGFRALATGQVGAAKGLFKTAGQSLSFGLQEGFRSGMSGFQGVVRQAFSSLPGLFAKISSESGRAFSRIKKFSEDASKSIDSFSKKAGFLAFQLQNLGFVASAAFTAPVLAIFGFATAIGVITAARIEQATAALKFLLPVGYDLEALLKRLQKTAEQSPIFDTTDLIQFTQTFVAAGVEIGKTERFLRAFSNVALVTGVDTQRATLAIRAITQAFGKGKLQAEELTQQLGEAMPAAMKIIREQLGVTQAELVAMVKAGEISGTELIDIFIKVGESNQFLQGAAAGAETLMGKWNQLKESVTNRLGKIFLENAEAIKQAVDKAGPLLEQLIEDAKPIFKDIAEGFLGFVDGIRSIVTWYKNLEPEQQSFIKRLFAIALAAGPIIIILGTLGAAVAGIAAGIAAIANPIGLAVLAVLAIGAAFVALWVKSDKLRDKLKEMWESFKENVITPFKTTLKESLDKAKEAWSKFVSQFTADSEKAEKRIKALKILLMGLGAVLGAGLAILFGVMKGAVKAFGPLVDGALNAVTGAIDAFSGFITYMEGLFTLDIGKMWEGIVQIFKGAWNAIAAVVSGGISATVNLIFGFVTGIIDFFKFLYDVLVGNSIIPDMVNEIIGWFTSLVSRGKAIFANLGRAILAFYSTYVQPFVESIKNGIDKVVSFFTGLFSRVKSALGNIGSALFEAGKSMIQGLINGIKAKASGAVDAAKGVVDAAIEGAKNLLDIGSPSKVFIDIGKETMRGFAIGLERSGPEVKAALNTSMSLPRFSGDFGERGRPAFEAGSTDRSALHIENYYSKTEDPYRQAEDWYFLTLSRGAMI